MLESALTSEVDVFALIWKAWSDNLFLIEVKVDMQRNAQIFNV